MSLFTAFGLRSLRFVFEMQVQMRVRIGSKERCEVEMSQICVPVLFSVRNVIHPRVGFFNRVSSSIPRCSMLIAFSWEICIFRETLRSRWYLRFLGSCASEKPKGCFPLHELLASSQGFATDRIRHPPKLSGVPPDRNRQPMSSKGEVVFFIILFESYLRGMYINSDNIVRTHFLDSNILWVPRFIGFSFFCIPDSQLPPPSPPRTPLRPPTGLRGVLWFSWLWPRWRVWPVSGQEGGEEGAGWGCKL